MQVRKRYFEMTRQMILDALFAVPGVRTASILDQSANGDKGAMTTVNIPLGVVVLHVTGGDLLAIGRALLKLRALGVQYEIVHTPVAVLSGSGKLTVDTTFGRSEAYVGAVEPCRACGMVHD
jgi:hypothetical protein